MTGPAWRVFEAEQAAVPTLAGKGADVKGGQERLTLLHNWPVLEPKTCIVGLLDFSSSPRHPSADFLPGLKHSWGLMSSVSV